MRKLNAVRKQMRANFRLTADSEAELLGKGVSSCEWAIVGRAWPRSAPGGSRHWGRPSVGGKSHARPDLRLRQGPHVQGCFET